MQPDRARTAQWWLNGAEQDLMIAREGAVRWSNAACFHAQQSAEKAIKAVLVVACGDVVRTHSLGTLLEELAEAGIDADASVVEAAKVLDKYYAPTRYPDALGGIDPTAIFTSTEASAAIALAENIVVFAKARLERLTGASDEG
jgi:HEPN domain-containing protein